MKTIGMVISALLLNVFLSCAGEPQQKQEKNKVVTPSANAGLLDTATFAAGCFWCVEAQFQQLNGVDTVVSGYTGGYVKNPSYKEVCTGNTGHAEAVNIIFDPKVISFDELIEAFFVAHDPTQLNRQGNDVGTQYRSAIFYHNPQQKEKALYYIKRLDEEHAYNKSIVTEVKPYGAFYIAEDYHQNYFNLNRSEGYCQFVIAPKLEKFEKVFKKKLKNNSEGIK
jgi:peptide-methionine (S)-S-oxide reductase